MAWKPPQVNRINADISTLTIYLRSVKKWGKTTLFRDVVMEKYGDPTRGLLVGCGSETGYTMLDGLNCTQVETYKDLTDLGNWLITKKGIEHNIEMVAFDTVDELVLICDRETIARYNKDKDDQKKCRSIKGAFGGYGAGSQYTANNLIKPYMSALKKAGFGIWAIAHTSMKTVKHKGDIESDGYQMLTSNIEKNSESAFGDVFDVVLTGVIDRNLNTKYKEGFNGKKIKENYVTEEVRKLYFRGTTVIDAGGRFAYDAVPEYMVFDGGNMAAEFIKIVEDGIEKSKTMKDTAPPQPRITEKVEIKAEDDEEEETTEGTMFDDIPAETTDDVASLQKQITAKFDELGGQKNKALVEFFRANGAYNKMTDVAQLKQYLEDVSKVEPIKGE